MRYVVHRRFQGNAICGPVNLSALTELDERDGMLYYQDDPICIVTSENAHRYFTRDDDGKGMQRGGLIQRILQLLTRNDEHYQDRWDKIWGDDLCQKYKHLFHSDRWLWNHRFYIAPVEDLEHILTLIK